MRRDAPTVTVLLPVHNGEPYLRTAVESVLAQTHADFELLVVDDGSTDDSRAIVRSYDDARIRLLENGRNLGLAASLNRGFAAARANLIARLDADDVCEPERLQHQVAFMDDHPETALLGTAYGEIDEAGRLLRIRRLPTKHADLCWALLFYCPFVHSAVMLRRSVAYEALGGYDEKLAYSMDYELWRRIARRFRVANLSEPLLRYRVSQTSMTATYGALTLEGRSIAVDGLCNLLGWDISEAERRFVGLQAVLKEPPVALPLDEIRWAAGEAKRLHRAFCRYFGLNADECGHRASALKAEIGGRLVEMVRQFPRSYSVPAGTRVLAAAAREHPPVLTSRAFAAAAAKLVLVRRDRK